MLDNEARSQNYDKQLLPLSSLCVSLSSWNNSVSTGWIFMKFYIWVFVKNLPWKCKVC